MTDACVVCKRGELETELADWQASSEAFRLDAERLTAENGKLRHAFRVNILRLVPGTSHAEIDDLMAALKDTKT